MTEIPRENVPQGSVVITPIEMYREMQDIGKKVDHLTDVVDPAIAQLRDMATANKTAIEKIDTRVDRLENWRSWHQGIYSVITLLISGGLITVMVEVFHH